MDPDFAPVAHHAQFCCAYGPQPIILPILVIAALVFGWALSTFIAHSQREQRLQRIWELIDARARAAIGNGEGRAVEMMIALKHEIRSQLGEMLARGEMAGHLKAVDDALNKAAKCDPAVAAALNATYSGVFALVDHRFPATEGQAQPESPPEPEGPLSPNAQAFKAAKKFHDYWKLRGERIQDLRDLQARLLRG